jgi:hypothetical protein
MQPPPLHCCVRCGLANFSWACCRLLTAGSAAPAARAARGDGTSLDTAAVQRALAAAATAGARLGHAVTVKLPGPAATYLVDAPLVLNASHAVLWVGTGAVLRWHWPKDLSFTERWHQCVQQRPPFPVWMALTG